jgi:CelD/BcsL family acetyltransferase involved in cellulose biosynthesis
MRTPYVPLNGLPETPESWLSLVSANFRSIVRRKSRKLQTIGAVRIRRVENADPKALQAFYNLEQSGWKGQEGTAIACAESTRQFYNEIAAEAEEFGYLALYFLEVNDKPIAAQFGLRLSGRYFMPKIAYDESQKEHSPGHLLTHGILADCIADGYSEFDFIGPRAEYKAKWTDAERPHSSHWIFARTVYGRVLHTLKFHIRPTIKKLTPGRVREWISKSPRVRFN